MTLEFAKKEAKRRTDTMGTAHYVLESAADKTEHLVTTVVYRGYKLIDSYLPPLLQTP